MNSICVAPLHHLGFGERKWRKGSNAHTRRKCVYSSYTVSLKLCQGGTIHD